MSQRRFVAGAVCPGCAQPDVLYLRTGDDEKRVFCVDCGEMTGQLGSDGSQAGIGESAPVSIIDLHDAPWKPQN